MSNRPGWVRVRDKGLLARLIRQWAAKRSQQTAADALNISQQHFSRLRNAATVPDRITAELLQQLIRRMGWRGELQRAVLSEHAMTALAAYYVWLKRELARYGWRLRRGKVGTGEALAELDRKDPRGIALLEARERLRSERGAFRGWGSYFAAFESWAERRGHSARSARVLLAQLRVVEPLTHDWAGGVEPDDYELLSDRKRLAKYLRAAFEREKALLDRLPDFERAQAAGAELEQAGLTLQGRRR